MEIIEKIEINDKQADFIEAIYDKMTADGVKTAGVVGGIGGGKTYMLALLMMISKEELPRAKGQFACLTITQFKRSIFPGIKNVWLEKFGLKEYNFSTGEGDYVLWRKPPADWDFPWHEPEDWDNCISFPNGWVCEACAYFLNPDIHRGRTDDFAFMDEAFKFKREWLKILQGRIRANLGKFHSNFHWLFLFFSTPDYGNNGDWMYDVEDQMKANPKENYFAKLTTKDNQAFLPANYIESLRAKLTSLEFSVEVEGKRITRIPKSFYPAFDYDKHTNIEAIQEKGKWYNANQDIDCSCDFNAHFTSCTIYQSDGLLLKCIMDIFVKEPDGNLTMAESLGKKVADRFKAHQRKVIYVTGDRNGSNKSAGSNKTFFEQFAEQLELGGFEVMLVPLLFNPEHQEKYLLTHNVFSEQKQDEYSIRFDPEQARSTVISIMHSPITAEYKKNKDSEKASNPNQERATHLSDTVDYYIIHKKKYGNTWSASGFTMSF